MKTIKISTLFNIIYLIPLVLILPFVFYWQYNMIIDHNYQDMVERFQQAQNVIKKNVENQKVKIKENLLSHVSKNNFYSTLYPHVDFIFTAKNGQIVDIEGFNIKVDVKQIAQKILQKDKVQFNNLEEVKIKGKSIYIILEKEKIIDNNLGKVKGEMYGVSIINFNTKLLKELTFGTNLEIAILDEKQIINSTFDYKDEKSLKNKLIDYRKDLYHIPNNNYGHLSYTKDNQYIFESDIYLYKNLPKFQILLFDDAHIYNEKIDKLVYEIFIMFTILGVFGIFIFLVIRYKFISKLLRLQEFIKKSFLSHLPLEYKSSKIAELDEMAKEFSELLAQKNLEKERFDLAIHSTNMGLWDWDYKSSKVYYSKAWKELLGYKEDEISNNLLEYKRLIHPDDISFVMNTLDKHLKDSKSMFNTEFRMKHKKGHYIWVYTVGKALYNNHDEIYRIIGFNRDISEKKMMENKLFHSEKLASMGEMLNMIAHQWRQPLNAISLIVNNIKLKFILENGYDKDKLLNELELLANHTQHLSSTITDFRNFFKKDKEKSLITLEEVLDQSIEIIKDTLQAHDIKLIRQYNARQQIEIFSNELKQVILNLIKNSEDALLENKIRPAYIKISTYTKDSKLFLEVDDNGGGINPEIIEKVFEPYFSTKQEKEGTGLGLYMSKIIIEEHCGGLINIYSENEKTTVKIQFNLKNK